MTTKPKPEDPTEIALLQAQIVRLEAERDLARAEAHGKTLAIFTHEHEAKMAKADAKHWRDAFLAAPRHHSTPGVELPISSNGFATV